MRAAWCVSWIAVALVGVGCKQASRSIGLTRDPDPVRAQPSTVASQQAASASAVAAVGSASAAPSASSSGSVPIVHYGAVTLGGTPTEQTFFGAPGFGSDPAHDAKEQAIVLMLFAPVDVMRGDGDDDFAEDRLGVRKVQIASTKDPAFDLRKLLGRPSKIQGKLVGAHGGHHHTDVVLVDAEPLAE
ncbi:MAG: hypothetical protein NVS3B10_27210 [Polyangiales bacterium]